jgi:ribosomal-protein-alanine N-acetyltransferase
MGEAGRQVPSARRLTMPQPIHTARLTLRELSPADAGFILRLLNEPAFLRYIGDRGVRNEADALGYLQQGPMASYARHGHGLLRVGLQSTDEPVGICGLVRRDTLPHADIGFAFLPEHCSRGYAVEAAAAAIHHGRTDLGLDEILAIVAPDNARSIRVLERLGLCFEREVVLSPGAAPLSLFRGGIRTPDRS